MNNANFIRCAGAARKAPTPLKSYWVQAAESFIYAGCRWMTSCAFTLTETFPHLTTVFDSGASR